MAQRILAVLICAALMCVCVPMTSALGEVQPVTGRVSYAAGEIVTVTWEALDGASSYRVVLLSGGEEHSSRLTNGLRCEFEYLDCGSYRAELFAVEPQGDVLLGATEFSVGNFASASGLASYSVTEGEAVFESVSAPGSFIGSDGASPAVTDEEASLTVSGYLLYHSYVIKHGESILTASDGAFSFTDGVTADARFFIIRQPGGAYVLECEAERRSVVTLRDGGLTLEPFRGEPEQLWLVTDAQHNSIDLTVPVSLNTERLPDKLTYVENTELDASGLICSLKYNTGIIEYLSSGFDVECDMSVPGTAAVTVRYAGLVTGYNILINEIEAESCEILTYPDKRVYALNEMLDMSGFTFHVKYTDGTEADLDSGYEIVGFNSSTPGTKLALAVYKGVSMFITFIVGDKTLTDFYILRVPHKTEYLEGEDIDLTGLYACSEYSDGTVEFVTEYSVSGYESTEGVHDITVSYGGLSDSFSVTVTKAEVRSLTIQTPPEATVYHTGELFSPDGLTLLATFDDLSTKVISDGITVYGYNPYFEGEQTLTAEYGGATVNFTITVIDSEEQYAPGDVDGDTFVTTSDARLALRAAAGLVALNNTQRLAADVDPDGVITTTDARIILRRAAHLE